MDKISMQGMWASALRRSVKDRAPAILKALRLDRSGKAPLNAVQRKAAMMLLRTTMTARQIEEKLGTVEKTVPKAKKSSAKRKATGPKRKAAAPKRKIAAAKQKSPAKRKKAAPASRGRKRKL